VACIVPGLCSMLVIPAIVYRMNPPELRHTPEARAFADGELGRMGRMDRKQLTVLAVFLAVCGLWVTTSIHHIDITITALLGAVALLLTGVLKWEQAIANKAAWDIFVWYGGLVLLGHALGDAGVTKAFADGVGHMVPGAGWIALLALALAIYFYAHYGFASITAHILSMFAPFCAVLIAKGAPPGLVVFSFACFANLAAGLTHYGTTPSPMFFAQHYVSLGKVVAYRIYHLAGEFVDLDDGGLCLVETDQGMVKEVTKCVIFDMGKVLIPFDFSRGYRAMEKLCAYPAAEIPKRIGTTDLVPRFETGLVEPRVFVEELSGMLGLAITYEHFCELWSCIFLPDPLIPEAMLAGLRKNYRLLLLSNTNAIHFDMVRKNFPLLRHFDDMVLSYEVKAMKPAPAIYQEAIARAQCRPEECFFTDDIPQYVEGARKQGIDAVQFVSCEQLQGELEQRGIRW
jgi:FMN phosphatase YigB (HAD superfamily)